ncbi:hypothetical protein [uncultured Polaribacter sp.]|uniref:hypothetical protein n=1 Tax=uncultured Polaribacter sp. TaxID=174711 RepID=UPI00259BB709|nr:hypothetical protein [uncultured Polaribacter sp.]
MKKLILAVVFVFATGTIMNANSLMTKDKSCSEIAFDLQGDLEDKGVDMETANEVANLIYEICETASE